MKLTTLLCLFGFLLALIAPSTSLLAQVPGTIAYQGYLTDSAGEPFEGSVNLALRLYDAPVAGTATWAESQLAVPVSEGVFAVQLGAVESLSRVSFEKPLWLGVTVNGGNELAPRVALTAAPYAFSTRGLRVLPAEDVDDAVSIIAGDSSNTVVEGDEGATIGGGTENLAGRGATIGGGRENSALDCYGTVAGGRENQAGGIRGSNKSIGFICGATVGGGNTNSANGEVATVSGGYLNEASAGYATISGGSQNTVSGRFSTVPGGSRNIASGNFSFAAGQQAQAIHDGSFVWNDANSEDTRELASTAENQFLIRATGGVGIGTNAPAGALHITDSRDGIDLVLGGMDEDSLFGDDGTISSDPDLPSSDLLLLSNDAVGIVLDVDDSGEPAEFIVTDSDFNMALQVNNLGEVTTGSIALENDLGQNTPPEAGGVYRDNLVYAWAHVNADGTISASFGCTVTRVSTGQYRVTYDRSLSNGMAPVVSPLSANDPVLAVVSPESADRTSVRLFNFANGLFQLGDRPFFIQVVGRP